MKAGAAGGAVCADPGAAEVAGRLGRPLRGRTLHALQYTALPGKPRPLHPPCALSAAPMASRRSVFLFKDLFVLGFGDTYYQTRRLASPKSTPDPILFGTRLAACRVIHRQLRLNRALRSGH